MSRMQAVSAVALALHLCDCSWIAVAPPGRHPGSADGCTTSRAASALDVAGAGVFGLGVVGLVVAAADVGCTGECWGSGIAQAFYMSGAAAALPGAIAYGASAAYGFRQTARCREQSQSDDESARVWNRESVPPRITPTAVAATPLIRPARPAADGWRGRLGAPLLVRTCEPRPRMRIILERTGPDSFGDAIDVFVVKNGTAIAALRSNAIDSSGRISLEHSYDPAPDAGTSVSWWIEIARAASPRRWFVRGTAVSTRVEPCGSP